MTVECPACHKWVLSEELISGWLIPSGVIKYIQKRHSDWSVSKTACNNCRREASADFLAEQLTDTRGFLSPADLRVIDSLRKGELLTSTPQLNNEDRDDWFARLANRLSAWISSWRFSILLLVFLLTWVILNVVWQPFEPYPVIILAVISAVLASLAALEGPFILLAQRHQQKRDRYRANQDYEINLKAELEIRNLHEKVDILLSTQARLFAALEEIQQFPQNISSTPSKVTEPKPNNF